MADLSHALTLGDRSIRELDGLYSLNDLHRASGTDAHKRPDEFLRLDTIQALIAEIQIAGIPAITAKPKVGTYACRELVIAYAAWISAAFHLKVIRVFLAASAPALPKYNYPISTASPRGRQFGNAWLTPRVLLDAKNRAPERDGHDVMGAKVPGALNAAPAQYLRFYDGGVEIV
jgi:hypothetical protein